MNNRLTMWQLPPAQTVFG